LIAKVRTDVYILTKSSIMGRGEGFELTRERAWEKKGRGDIIRLNLKQCRRTVIIERRKELISREEGKGNGGKS